MQVREIRIQFPKDIELRSIEAFQLERLVGRICALNQFRLGPMGVTCVGMCDGDYIITCSERKEEKKR